MEDWSVTGGKRNHPACFSWHWFQSAARSKTPYAAYFLAYVSFTFTVCVIIPSSTTLPDVSHIPITLSPHVRKTMAGVVSAQLLEWASEVSTVLVCQFGLRGRPGPTVRKWPFVWFKLVMKQLWFAGERREKRSVEKERECIAICKPHEREQ